MSEGIPGLDQAHTRHGGLIAWVREIAALTRPARVQWCDGSQQEWEQLTRRLTRAGTLVQLSPDQRPGMVWFKTTKGHGYPVTGYRSHGTPLSLNDARYWGSRRDFASVPGALDVGVQTDAGRGEEVESLVQGRQVGGHLSQLGESEWPDAAGCRAVASLEEIV